MDDHLIFIIAGVGGLVLLILLLLFIRKRCNTEGFTPLEDRKMWVDGDNPITQSFRTVPVVEQRSETENTLTQAFDVIAGSYCRSATHNRVVRNRYPFIGHRRDKAMFQIEDARINQVMAARTVMPAAAVSKLTSAQLLEVVGRMRVKPQMLMLTVLPTGTQSLTGAASMKSIRIMHPSSRNGGSSTVGPSSFPSPSQSASASYQAPLLNSPDRMHSAGMGSPLDRDLDIGRSGAPDNDDVGGIGYDEATTSAVAAAISAVGSYGTMSPRRRGRGSSSNGGSSVDNSKGSRGAGALGVHAERPMPGISPLDLSRSKTRNALVDVLTSLHHPFVLETLEVGFSHDNASAMIVRPFCDAGSLKDAIYNCKPTDTYASKYEQLERVRKKSKAGFGSGFGEEVKMQRKGGLGMPIKLIRRYGRQVLEGLAYLHKAGIPYFHLHTGNVVLHEGVCKLTDYESSFFGWRHRLQAEFKKYSVHALHTSGVEIVSFGHLLFEMATGVTVRFAGGGRIDPAQVRLPREYADVQRLLRLIFGSDEAVTIDDLLSDAFFAVALGDHAKLLDGPVPVYDKRPAELIRVTKAFMLRHYQYSSEGGTVLSDVMGTVGQSSSGYDSDMLADMDGSVYVDMDIPSDRGSGGSLASSDRGEDEERPHKKASRAVDSPKRDRKSKKKSKGKSRRTPSSAAAT